MALKTTSSIILKIELKHEVALYSGYLLCYDQGKQRVCNHVQYSYKVEIDSVQFPIRFRVKKHPALLQTQLHANICV